MTNGSTRFFLVALSPNYRERAEGLSWREIAWELGVWGATARVAFQDCAKNVSESVPVSD